MNSHTLSLVPATLQRVYFVGIGGIGMSALARHFAQQGLEVAGYDRAQTALTAQMEKEGIAIRYSEDPGIVPTQFCNPNPAETLIVYTPAIPTDSPLLNYFQQLGHPLRKRAEVLAAVTEGQPTYAVAGTHGKTTSTSMLSHLLASYGACRAFLGGIAANFNSNYVNIAGGEGAPLPVVVEADEFDRSFLRLTPRMSAITSIAPDHLECYGTYEAVIEAFREFALRNTAGRVACPLRERERLTRPDLALVTYAIEAAADYSAHAIHYDKGFQCYTLRTPGGEEYPVRLAVPGRHNVENSMGVLILAKEAGLPLNEAIRYLETYRGVARRFSIQYDSHSRVYVDDYAHHPDEIRATIAAAREMFPGRRLTGIFQPHLYTRTQSLMEEFAKALSLLDVLYLLPIYPARELPIEGVTSEALAALIPARLNACVVPLEYLPQLVRTIPLEVLISMGAGSIGEAVPTIVKELKGRES